MDNVDRQAERMFSIIGQETGEEISFDREPGELPVPERNVVKLAESRADEPEDPEEGIATEDLETQLTAAVDDITDAMTTLRSELIMGSPPRTYEVFSQLAASRVSAISELAKLRVLKRKAGQDERKTKISERKQELAENKFKNGGKAGASSGGGTGSIPMTGRQILELAKEAVSMHKQDMAAREVQAEVIPNKE